MAGVPIRIIVWLAALAACAPSADVVERPDSTSDVAPALAEASAQSPAEGTADAASGPCPAVGTPLQLDDSAAYLNDIVGGHRAVLRAAGTIVDTVDLAFGVHSVGEDSVLFLPVRSGPGDEPGSTWVGITRHVLCAEGKRVLLGPQLPAFHDYFSSPVVIDSAIVYWGLAEIGDSEFALTARRFDFRSARHDSLPLIQVPLQTDYRFHLPQPEPTAGGAEFRYQEDSWTLPVRERITSAGAPAA